MIFPGRCPDEKKRTATNEADTTTVNVEVNDDARAGVAKYVNHSTVCSVFASSLRSGVHSPHPIPRVAMSHPVDRSNLAQVIQDFPAQFAAGMALADGLTLPPWTIRRVLVSGMGGSALPADLLADALEGQVELRISREYELHPVPDGETLLFVNSFSGTTEETLAAFDAGRALGVPMIAVSHGGILAERAKEAGVPHLDLPAVIQPRYATGLFVSAMLGVLMRLGVAKNLRAELLALESSLDPSALEEQGRELAAAIGDRVPFVYSSERLRAVARNWKIKINENAKTQACWNVFPELNHNEMVGFTHLRLQPAFVLLRSPLDHPRVQKRMRIFAELLEEKGAVVRTADAPEGSFFHQAFSLLLLGDWVSYFLALNAGVDPTPVEMVEDFKRRMAA